MNTALATQTSTDEQSLILPNKREALLMRLNEFKTDNLSARELKDYKDLTQKSTSLFIKLCWSKLGVSSGQLKKLEQQEINELAGIIHEQSRTTAIVHTGILTCIPVIGWLVLLITLGCVEGADDDFWNNMRYYWWYRRMRNKYSNDFKPALQGKG
ncbi:MAG: hypothetical protein HY505_02365 [Candidatus Yanofskybacteria bacterium]|nr:hypothetical protein [Candidatus Yanofskybacteria bacterium]